MVLRVKFSHGFPGAKSLGSLESEGFATQDKNLLFKRIEGFASVWIYCLAPWILPRIFDHLLVLVN